MFLEETPESIALERPIDQIPIGKEIYFKSKDTHGYVVSLPIWIKIKQFCINDEPVYTATMSCNGLYGFNHGYLDKVLTKEDIIKIYGQDTYDRAMREL